LTLSPSSETPLEPLGPEDTTRLTEFARACKAAARAVVLYPAAHPAIASSLGRIAALTDPAALPQPLTVSVLPEGLLVGGRKPARPDAAIAELAALLHTHWIGEMVIHPGGDAEAWRSFLLLLSRAPEAVRLDGGITRLWTTMGGRHVEVREIDYGEVLREHAGGDAANWSRIIDSCLEGRTMRLDSAAAQELLALATEHPEQLAELIGSLEASARREGGVSSSAEAVLRLLTSLAEVAAAQGQERVDVVLQNVAGALGRLSPELMSEVLKRRLSSSGTESEVVDQIVGKMTDADIARYVASNISSDRAATRRLAEVFSTLVPDDSRRDQVLSMAHDEAAGMEVGSQPDFEGLWGNVTTMLVSYSDEPWVSKDYDRELTDARIHAMEVERVSDDPPDRMATWLGSVSATALRHLDLAVLLDLLRIEAADEDWAQLLPAVVNRVQDLLLVGDAESANQLVAVVAGYARSEVRGPRLGPAGGALDQLVEGPMMRHIVTHLPTMSDEQFASVQAIVTAVGSTLIGPLAEALAAEARTRPRERLTSLLLGFGATGQKAVERLRNSPNAAVRRTAIHLLREFGGSDALPDLTELLKDSEPHVQREAVLAILTIGTEEAYGILQQALVTGTARSRELIMQALGTVRDGRATPVYAYIVEHVGYKGALGPVYLQAIESLGAARDPLAVPVLRTALYKGEWWAPGRTAAIRDAVARALGRIGGDDAIAALRDASNGGPRGVRTAARAGLEEAESAARYGRRRDG
jgi:hypothetical protein